MKKPCQSCGGSGQINYFKGVSRFLLSSEECPECSGLGYIFADHENADDPSEEKIIIVDDHNNEVGSATRREMRERNLPHRASFILVFNSNDRLFVQQRTAWKDIYPGYYDVTCGGVVQEGETYEISAARELAEELGIKETKITPLFDFYYKETTNKVWGRAFVCTYDGDITLQQEEVAGGAFLPIEEVVQLTATKSFTPDGLLVLNRFLAGQQEQKRGTDRS
jgi:isopentenyldiphosphate isomerase